MEILSVCGIVVGIAMMMFLSYRGVSIYVYTLASTTIVLLTAGIPFWETILQSYMGGFSKVFMDYFILFALSSAFAFVMGESGAAQVIATTILKLTSKSKKHQKLMTILSLHILTLVLTYGGINLFVVIFLMVRIGKSMFEKLNIPWHIYHTAGWASGTVTMTMLPGTPAIHNLIPMKYLGTTPYAAPIIGLLCTAICVVLELIYVVYVLKRSERRGEGFLPTGALIATTAEDVNLEECDIPFWKALLPPVILLVVMNFVPIPAVEVSLLAAVISALVLYHKSLPKPLPAITRGIEQSINVVASVAAIVGFGSVIAVTPGYAAVVEGLGHIPGPPLIRLVLAVNVCAGLAGSAAGGLVIGLNSFAKMFMDMGINPQVIHRLACISSGGLDSLPHNSAIISSLRVAGLSMKEAYHHSFWQGLVIPIIVAGFAVLFASLGIV